jgi:hypothetical protein
MTQYFLDIEYNNLVYDEQEVNLKEFECCTFNGCDFSLVPFTIVFLAEPESITWRLEAYFLIVAKWKK